MLSIFIFVYYIINKVIKLDTITLKNKEIEYQIIRMKKKNISFMYKDNILIIRAPYLISKKEILEIVKLNEERIYSRLINSPKNKKESLKFEIGQTIKVVEKEYQILESSRRSFDGNNFYVRKDKVDQDVFYLAAIKIDEYASKRTKEYFDSMYKFEKLPNIIYKSVKGFYGKYSKTKNQITYNISLAFLDKELIDYVIVHELSHIKYLNHQKEFYNFLKIFLPNYKYLEKRLKQEGRVKWK